jgi:hypothetical protein
MKIVNRVFHVKVVDNKTPESQIKSFKEMLGEDSLVVADLKNKGLWQDIFMPFYSGDRDHVEILYIDIDEQCTDAKITESKISKG